MDKFEKRLFLLMVISIGLIISGCVCILIGIRWI